MARQREREDAMVVRSLHSVDFASLEENLTMSYSDNFQNAFQQNPNGLYGGAWNVNPTHAWGPGAQASGQPQYGWGQGLGQQAFGYGPNFGNNQGWGQNAGGNFGGQWQQRQLSHQDVGEVVRQLLPILPQVIAQAQHQPQAAFGQGGYGAYGAGYGGSYGPGARNLSQQDVNEVVRQILPVIPQIVSLLQGQQQQGSYANAVYGGGPAWNSNQGWNNQGGNQGWNNQAWHNPAQHNQGAFGNQNPYQSNAFGPFGQAAFGGNQGLGQQRQLNQAEVGEIVRQLTAALPQVIANLQAINQQPNIQQRAAA